MTTQERINLIEDFIDFASYHLKIDKLPKMTFIGDKSWVLARHSFGEYTNETNSIVMYIANRNLADVLRTLGHELTHHRQNELGLLYTQSGETGSPVEDEANVVAGILMREFGKKHELIYEGIKLNVLKQLIK
jgi:Zn-dependent peptidase ImmA (M78 family)